MTRKDEIKRMIELNQQIVALCSTGIAREYVAAKIDRLKRELETADDTKEIDLENSPS